MTTRIAAAKMSKIISFVLIMVWAPNADQSEKQAPCRDSVYQALLARDYSTLTRIERKLLDKKKAACAANYDSDHPISEKLAGTDSAMAFRAQTNRYLVRKGSVEIIPRIAMGIAFPGRDVEVSEKSILQIVDFSIWSAYLDIPSGDIIFDFDRAEDYYYTSGLIGADLNFYLSDRVAIGCNYTHREIDQNLSLAHYQGTHDPDGKTHEGDKIWSEPFLISDEIGPIVSLRIIQRKRFGLFASLGIAGLTGSLSRNAALLAFYNENKNMLDTFSVIVDNIVSIQESNNPVNFNGLSGQVDIRLVFFFNPFLYIECAPKLHAEEVFLKKNSDPSYPDKITTMDFSVNVGLGLQLIRKKAPGKASK